MSTSAKRIEIEIIGDAKNFQNALGKAAGSSDKFGSSLAKLGKLAAVGLAAVGAGAVFAGSKMLKLAGDAQEVDSKMNVVFGKELPKLKQHLDDFSAATGASSFKLREQAADMGALLGPLVGTKKGASEMSEQFVKLATDLGSFNNVPVDEALLAIRSGLVGEAEPLRRFGVLINEAAVNTEALRLGLVKGNEKLTEQQKVMARGSLIMQQTTQAQGDAIRTAGSYTNQMKALKNTVTDLATGLGVHLLPAATAVAGGLNTFIKKIAEADGAGAKFGVAMDAIKTLATDAANGLVAAFNKVDWEKTWDKLVASAGTVATRLRDALDQKLGAVDWGNVGSKIADGISAAISTTGSIGKKIADVVGTAMRSVDWVSFGKAAGPGLATALVVAFATLMDVSFWIKNWDLALAVALAMFGKGLGKLVAPIGVLLKGVLSKTWDDAVVAIAGAVERWFPKIAAVLASVLGRLPAIVAAGLAKLVSPVTSAFAKLGRLAQFTVKVLGLAAVINAITAFVVAAWGKFQDLLGKIASLPGLVRAQAVAIGRALTDGVIAGIGDIGSRIYNAAAGGLMSAVNRLKGLAGIRSPSELMAREIGEPLAQGIVTGFDGGLARLSPRMVAATAAVFDRIKAMVDARKTVLDTAWAKIGEGIDRAFGAKTQQLLTNLSSAWDVQINKVRAWAAELTNAERALSAFDLAGQAQTMSELALATMDAAEAERSRQQALSAAGAALAKAQAMPAGEDAKQVRELADAKQDLATAQAKNAAASTDATLKAVREAGQKVADLERGLGAETLQRAEERSAAILAAEESLRSANLAITRAGLQAQATLERDALAAKRLELAAAAQQEREQRDLQVAERIAAMEAQKAAELTNLEEFRRIQGEQLTLQLAQLQAHLLKHPKEWKKTQAAIVKLLKSYGVDYNKAGELLGNAFASGLKASEAAVEKAAKNLAKIPQSYLQLKSPAEKGPLSTIDSWFKPMGSMLARQMNGSALSGAASRMASGAAMGGSSMAMAGGGGGTVNHFHFPHYVGNERTLVDAVRTEVQRTIARNK